jgi:hypothetical protein
VRHATPGREQMQGNVGLFNTTMFAGSWKLLHNTSIFCRLLKP